MNIKLLGNRVLVEVGETGEIKTNSGLLVAKKREPGEIMSGVVKYAGNAKIDSTGAIQRMSNGGVLKLEVEKGDKVFFEFGREFLVDGKMYYLVSESDIIAIYTDDEEKK